MFQIESWLHTLGLGHYAGAFIDNHIDAATLALLTDADLKELGIRSLGHRRRLLAAIAQLTNPSSSERSATARNSGDRRTVTVLFCDMASSTRLFNEHDTEEVHALMARYFDTVDGVVEVHGGHVDKHFGDVVMAVFGAPVAHTNDPERAVRAAFAIRDAVAALSPPIHVHIGIASGPVVASRTGSRTHDEYTMTGAAVNLAARLQNKAGAGEILMSCAVAQAVVRFVDGVSMGAHELKGIDGPVEIWRAECLRAEIRDLEAAPLVGRIAELATFTEMLEGCLAHGHGRVLYLRGEAGIGKTRLLAELRALAAVRGFDVHTGLILDFGDGEGQSAIADVVASLLGLGRNAGESERDAAVQAARRAGLITPPDDMYLCDLLDVPLPARLRARYDAMPHLLRSHGKREAVARILAGRAARAPQLIVVEDAHWADLEMLQHIVGLGRGIARIPVLLAVTSRSHSNPLAELVHDDTVPMTGMELAPLAPDQALTLVRRLVDAADRIAYSWVERAGGNPLFLEQLMQSAEMLPGGLSGGQSDGPPCGVQGGSSAGVLPDSIHSVVLARIDGLEPGDKRALQTASIMGQRFSLTALRFLLDEPNYTCDRLLAHRLIRDVDDGEYLFAHALVLEGVYASMLKSQRIELHRRAARWFDGRNLPLRAEHLERAEDSVAAHAYWRAATALAAEYHFNRALALVERGCALAQTRDRAMEQPLTCLRGELLHKLGNIEAALAAYERALSLAGDDIERCRAWIGMAECMRISDRTDEALPILDRAKIAAAAHELTAELAMIHILRAAMLFPRDDIEGCLSENQQARILARRIGSPMLEARALSGLGDAHFLQGRIRTSTEHFERCIELCREHSLGAIEVANLAMLSAMLYYQLDFDTSIRYSFDAVEMAGQVGNLRAELTARCGPMCWLYLDLGRYEDVLAQVDRSQEIAAVLSSRRFIHPLLTNRGIACWHLGRKDEGMALLVEAASLARQSNMSFHGPAAMSAIALFTDDPAVRQKALADGEAALSSTNGHTVFQYYRDAIDACLGAGDLDAARRYIDKLNAHTSAEPLPWTALCIQRGQALVRHADGERTVELAAELQSIHDQAASLGLLRAMQGVDRALAET